MEELFNCGIDDIEIKNIIEINPETINLSDMEIKEKVEILKNIKCNDNHIKNIIVSNPLYLNRCNNDIVSLIENLGNFGITNLNILFDTNPWLLNKNAFEINGYVKKKMNEGFLLEDIVDMIDTNPYIIDEE